MEKNINSAIATLLSVLLIFVYLLPYYMPFSYADEVSNSSAIINGSISGIPAGVTFVLFIVNNNNNQFTPVMGLSSSNNVFSQEVSANDGDIFGFKINGKVTGTTVTYHPGTTLNVQLQYTSPGEGVTVVPAVPIVATPVPFKINVTPTATPTPLPTSVPTVTAEPTATPAPISSSPTASPSPTPTSPFYPLIFAILIGIIMLALIIIYLRKK